MDSDRQDDSSGIADFPDRWQQGYDMAYAVRTRRKVWWGKRLLSAGFYRLRCGFRITERRFGE